jgi:hypothetical protein
MTDKVWLKRNDGSGDPQEFEAVPSVIVPLIIAGWSQCPPPEKPTHVDDKTPRNPDRFRKAEAD